MGIMGHFVGDASQPLHTTVSYNGWRGPNPHGYTIDRAFHEWIDGELSADRRFELETMAPKIQPATTVGQPNKPDTVFRAVVVYITDQNKLVEPLYQMEKDGKLSGDKGKGLEGKPFLETQLVKAGQMLGDLWLTAWKESQVDAYLEHQLQLRNSPPRANK